LYTRVRWTGSGSRLAVAADLALDPLADDERAALEVEAGQRLAVAGPMNTWRNTGSTARACAPIIESSVGTSRQPSNLQALARHDLVDLPTASAATSTARGRNAQPTRTSPPRGGRSRPRARRNASGT
jgi:hypothetical protein